ncbi:MAG: Crp/Fnr family transcriptional regulator [Planctomycetota bacterium]|nr:MAG: Crp/Fnr family transcriptional regulator [Planctomycetota bacterium]
MSSDTRRFAGCRNAILAKIPDTELQRIRPLLHPVEFEPRLVLYEPGRAMRYACFLEEGMVSAVSVMEDGRTIEVGNIGREGVVGGLLLLEADSVDYRHVVQVPGHGLRMAASDLREAAEVCPEFRACTLRYVAAFLAQTMQGMACNGLHSVQQRCCRWLLMGRDRVGSDELEITHEALALTLGVRRASVSEVLRPLQQKGLVRYSRGRITILDRPGLEAGACECYRIVADRYREILC